MHSKFETIEHPVANSNS